MGRQLAWLSELKQHFDNEADKQNEQAEDSRAMEMRVTRIALKVPDNAIFERRCIAQSVTVKR